MALMPPVSAMNGTMALRRSARARWIAQAVSFEPGERDAADARVLDERFAQPTAARQQVQHVGRHARLVQQLGGEEGGDRRLLGRLGDHRVAGGERGGDLPGEYGEREIPWRDAGEHAAAVERQRVALAGRPGQRHGAGEQAPRLRRVVAQEIDRFAHVALRVVQRLAGLAHDDGHQARLVALEQIGGGGEDLRPLGAAQLVPSRARPSPPARSPRRLAPPSSCAPCRCARAGRAGR